MESADAGRVLPLDRRVSGRDVPGFTLLLAGGRRALPVRFRPLREQPRAFLRVLPAPQAGPARPRPSRLFGLLIAADALLALAALLGGGLR